MNSLVSCRARGFTLIELLITLVVVVVLLTIGLPSMQSFFDRERLISATEQVYSHLQQARIESIARSRNIYLTFDTSDGGLKYGFSQRSGCNPDVTDPTNSTACVLLVDDGAGATAFADLDLPVSVAGTALADDVVLMRFDVDQYSNTFQDIKLTEDDVEYSKFEIMFDALRGIPYEYDSVSDTVLGIAPQVEILLPSLERELRLNLGSLGQMSICSPDDSVSGYSKCPPDPDAEEG